MIAIYCLFFDFSDRNIFLLIYLLPIRQFLKKMGKGILGPNQLMKKNKKTLCVPSIKWVYVKILPMLYSKRGNYKKKILEVFFFITCSTY